MKRLLAIVLLVAACSPPNDTVATTSPLSAPTSRPAVTARPTAKPAAAPVEVYYENCAAVRAAGKDPLGRSDPGYRAGLDRDDDGIACE